MFADRFAGSENDERPFNGYVLSCSGFTLVEPKSYLNPSHVVLCEDRDVSTAVRMFFTKSRMDRLISLTTSSSIPFNPDSQTLTKILNVAAKLSGSPPSLVQKVNLITLLLLPFSCLFVPLLVVLMILLGKSEEEIKGTGIRNSEGEEVLSNDLVDPKDETFVFFALLVLLEFPSLDPVFPSDRHPDEQIKERKRSCSLSSRDTDRSSAN